MFGRSIVVGSDGTESSNAAVDWAAREALACRLPLRIVHVVGAGREQAGSPADGEHLGREAAESIVAAARDRVRRVAATIAVETDTVTGDAAPCLLEASRGAEVLVLGNRGRGGFAGLLLGSVSQKLATHAVCPVVVVRGRTGEAGGPIVAGVDDSPAAGVILEDAFTMAAAHDLPITVLRSYLPVSPLRLYDVVPEALVTPEQDDTERARLHQLLRPWRTRFPTLTVDVEVTHAGAAHALVRASRHAGLIIVGSRGRGELAGTMLGSTSLQVMHHAECPVRITRERA
ncbi:universal stress protein [Actinoplanes sp. NPDC049802]|uniref:universal stress protein n=1 Tax=Actinoplanes sp. NPDC049802 TaxID=3154742 RepID=UPI0033D5C765